MPIKNEEVFEFCNKYFQTGKNTYLRYYIVEHTDLIRDLQYWETLSISSLLLRPVLYYI